MLEHDYKRRTNPQVKIDQKHKCCIIPKGSSLASIQDHSIKKYTKTETYFTTPELNELFKEQEQVEENIKYYATCISQTWPEFKTDALINIIGRLDVVTAFASFIAQHDPSKWCKPEITVHNTIQITQAWNPMVENCRSNDFKQTNIFSSRGVWE